uniref:Uncharacterized protein n=1 Tax=Anguilla anguilla TaxID=7936 RepID=A0A0E9WDJ2_ANGAN
MGSLMTTVSQDLSLTSHPKDGISYSTVSLSLHWGIGVYLTRRKIAPCWPTPLPAATQYSLMVSHSSTNQAHTCLASASRQECVVVRLLIHPSLSFFVR